MEQITVAKAVSLKGSNARLNQLMILASGICLLTVFYINGTFSGNIFSSPKPQGGGNKSSGIPASADRTTATTSVSNVAAKALAFEALLTTAQQDTLQQTYTTTLARKWSNLPCGAMCRNGIEFGSLNSSQLAAALAVIRAALGTTTNNGNDEFLQIRLAEIILNESGGGGGYDTTLRWICFLNTPSATGAWMLQFGGHHYAANIAFNNGHVVGATPFFMGLEPKTFTWNSTTYAPLNDEHDAFAAMLASLTSTELTSAKLTATYTDCTMIPGETDGGTGAFPTAKVGIACSTLTTSQQNLVLAAIYNYVVDMDSTTAASVMAVYTREIAGTYIAYTGNGTTGDASTFLDAATNYVRIDGPTVWIEFICQNGIVFPSQIHYHTVWRDHSHDYGVDLAGDPIDTSVSTAAGLAQVTKTNILRIYPNPASNEISMSMSTAVKDADVMLVNAMGQSTTIAAHYSGAVFQYSISDLPAGLYILKIQDGSSVFTGRFNKL